jgi:nucleoside-diphosphate-sugar epimerase
MKILIIGCGYVGKAIASYWKKAGHIITATTRKKERIEELKPYADCISLLESKSLGQALMEQEAVLLCVAPDRSSNYRSAYLETAQQLISDLSFSVKQIIYTGSTSVYGDFGGGLVFEDTLPNPQSTHSKILLETEEILLKAIKPGRAVCILRLGEIIGPERSIEQKLNKRCLASLPGTGENITNISPLEDIVSGLDFALTHNLNGIFNLCNDFHIKRKEWYQRICIKENLPLIEWDAAQCQSHGGNKIVSNAKIKSAGFQFSDDALKRLQE